MRYLASEKLEIIRLVERSHLPAKQTLDVLGVPRTTFYRWYERYRLEGHKALEDKAPLPARVWNRTPDKVRGRLITLALDRPELSPRELAITFTDTEGYFEWLRPMCPVPGRLVGFACSVASPATVAVDLSTHGRRCTT